MKSLYIYSKSPELEIKLMEVSEKISCQSRSVTNLEDFYSTTEIIGGILIVDLRIPPMENQTELTNNYSPELLNFTEKPFQTRKFRELQNQVLNLKSRYSGLAIMAIYDHLTLEISELDFDLFNEIISDTFNSAEMTFRLSKLFSMITASKREQVISYCNYEIDQIQRIVRAEEVKYRLPRKEFDLFKVLAESPNRIFTRSELLSKVWFESKMETGRTVDTHIAAIRKKLQLTQLKSIRGVGYVLELPKMKTLDTKGVE